MTGPGLAEMNAFVAIAEQRSFAKAAVRLGLSPSTLSETLRRLEERLGVRLIERTTRSVVPTEAGERLLARLRPVLEDYEAAHELINDFRATPSGSLRLTVVPPAADLVLSPLLARFAAQYPEIRLEISVDDALTDIVAGRFDAGLRHGERLERDMIALRVTEELRQMSWPRARISSAAAGPRPRRISRVTTASASGCRAGPCCRGALCAKDGRSKARSREPWSSMISCLPSGPCVMARASSTYRTRISRRELRQASSRASSTTGCPPAATRSSSTIRADGRYEPRCRPFSTSCGRT